MTSRTGPDEMTLDDSGFEAWRHRAQLADLVMTFGAKLEADPMVEALAEAMLAASIGGTGAMIQSLDGSFRHLPNTEVFTWPAPPPMTPAEANAICQRLMEEEIESCFYGLKAHRGRLRPLTAALRAIYPTKGT